MEKIDDVLIIEEENTANEETGLSSLPEVKLTPEEESTQLEAVKKYELKKDVLNDIKNEEDVTDINKAEITAILATNIKIKSTDSNEVVMLKKYIALQQEDIKKLSSNMSIYPDGTIVINDGGSKDAINKDPEIEKLKEELLNAKKALASYDKSKAMQALKEEIEKLKAQKEEYLEANKKQQDALEEFKALRVKEIKDLNQKHADEIEELRKTNKKSLENYIHREEYDTLLGKYTKLLGELVDLNTTISSLNTKNAELTTKNDMLIAKANKVDLYGEKYQTLSNKSDQNMSVTIKLDHKEFNIITNDIGNVDGLMDLIDRHKTL